jgi:hypothetical protein
VTKELDKCEVCGHNVRAHDYEKHPSPCDFCRCKSFVPPQAVEPASDPLTILIDYCRTKDVGYGGWTATHAAALVSLQGRTSQTDEAQRLRDMLFEVECIVQGEAYQLGLAEEGGWGEIPANLHIADKLDKYILREHWSRHARTPASPASTLEIEEEMYCRLCGSCGIPDCCGFRCLYVQDHRAEYESMMTHGEQLYEEADRLRATLAEIDQIVNGEADAWDARLAVAAKVEVVRTLLESR